MHKLGFLLFLALGLAGCLTTGPGARWGAVASTAAEAAALCKADAGDPATIRANCDLAINSGSAGGEDLARLLTVRGNALSNLYDYPAALADHRSAVELDPDSAYRLRQLGWELNTNDRYEEALAAFNKALEMKPESANGHAGRGQALRYLKRYEAARTAFELGKALDPSDVWFTEEIGWLYIGQGRPKFAERRFREAIKAAPGGAWGYHGLARALHFQKRYDEALAAWARAIELDPTVPNFFALRGNTLRFLDKNTAALEDANRAMALYPNYTTAHQLQAWALFDLDRDAEAVTAFRDALALNDDKADTHYGLSRALTNLKRFTEAYAPAIRAVELAGDDPDYWHQRGFVRLNTDRFAAAIEDFRMTLKLKPDSSAARYNIAIAQALLGRGADTLEALAVALEHDHNPDYASDVVSSLLKSGLRTEAVRASRMINQSDSLESA